MGWFRKKKPDPVTHKPAPIWFPNELESLAVKPKELMESLRSIGQRCLDGGLEFGTRVFYFADGNGVGMIPQPDGCPNDDANAVFKQVAGAISAKSYGVMGSVWASSKKGRYKQASDDPDRKSMLFIAVRDGDEMLCSGFSYSIDHGVEDGEPGHIFDIKDEHITSDVVEGMNEGFGFMMEW